MSITPTILALDTLCPYFTRFPLSFPNSVLTAIHSPGSVLDPFCGSGTVLLAARGLGHDTIGLDTNPIAVCVARAKLLTVTPEAVLRRAETILSKYWAGTQIPDTTFWKRCYAPTVLRALCCFREHFSTTLEQDEDVMLCAILLGLLHGPSDGKTNVFLSNTMPASFAPSKSELLQFWTQNQLFPHEHDVLQVITRRSLFLLRHKLPNVSSTVWRQDSRISFKKRITSPCRYVITSPPYFGVDPYATSQWLRLWFLGKKFRKDTRINQQTQSHYLNDLALVWRNCADVCHEKAYLIIRYGKTAEKGDIPPQKIVEDSLEHSNSGWTIYKTRQVARTTTTPKPDFPFIVPAPRPLEEIEVFARLKK